MLLLQYHIHFDDRVFPNPPKFQSMPINFSPPTEVSLGIRSERINYGWLLSMRIQGPWIENVGTMKRLE